MVSLALPPVPGSSLFPAAPSGERYRSAMFKRDNADFYDGYSTELPFVNNRGQRINAYSILPRSTADIRAALVFCHGYAEHSRRKLDAFRQLAESGIAVYAFDMHGFGHSEPKHPCKRALIWDYQHLVDDMSQFGSVARAAHADQRLPACPWFLAGFSLGGLTAAHVALREQEQWQGLVLVAGCMWVRMTLITQLQRMVGPILNYLLPTAKIVQRLHPARDLFSWTHPIQVKDYCNDPLVYRQATFVSTAWQMGQAILAMKAQRTQLELPIFALHATNDKITPYKDLADFYQSVSSADKELDTIDGGYHDLWGGSEAHKHVASVIRWITKTAEFKDTESQTSG